MDEQEKQKAIAAIQAAEKEHGLGNADAMAKMMERVGEELHPALQPWVFESPMGEMVKHPWVFQIFTPLHASQANDFYNAKRKIRREYLNEKNWEGYIWAHERPFRMRAFEKLYRRKKISRQQAREMFPDFWCDFEFPHKNGYSPLWLLHEIGFVTDDEELWADLQEHDKLKIYRGAGSDRGGYSWSLDKEKALWFANRFDPKKQGKVIATEIPVGEVLAYLTGRGEDEIICDPALMRYAL